ncbi:MAG: hypothetical protein ACR2QI_06335 [Woeseiaceae bacterium]
MQRTVPIIIAASLLFAGCGSSGGGGVSGPVDSPVLTVPITSNNAMEVAKVTWATALETGEFGDLSGTGLPLGSTSGSVSKLDSAIAMSAKSSGQAQVPIPAETTSCDVSGDVTVSGQIEDPVTPTLTAGDYFEIDYNNCDDGFGETIDGLMRMDIDAFNGDFLSEMFDMTVTLTLSTFQITSGEDVVTSHGDVTATIDTTTMPSLFTGISGNSMTIDTNASSESLTNFAASLNVDGTLQPALYARSSSGTLDSTQLAGAIRYSTPVTFEGLGNDFPNSGEFLVEGDKSSLRLTALSNVDVQIDIDSDGDGNVDETILTTWAELTA